MHCSSAGASFLVKISSFTSSLKIQQLHFFVENQQLHCYRKTSSCIPLLEFSSCVVFIKSADALYISRCIPIELIQQLHSFVRILQFSILQVFRKISRCTVHQQLHCYRKTSSCIPLLEFSSCVVFIKSADALCISRCIPIELIQQLHSFVRILQLHCFHKISRCTVHQQVLLAEPLGSLAFKMVHVRQLEIEQKVKLEIQLLGGVVFIQGLSFPCLSCIILI
ncbi:hypothetical protein F511_16775 [Dorcoceras hygrometricum]|uniref:Uncharacterized protein n=1 Tax=Dorcoceras hygrometricum TaxID=472368 RepID=A0A2Z7C336_9LAMI|nr:hypothetical protein F511_16775 [Dorcoceras hygrometricum]